MRAHDVVWNPLTGEKALIVESAAESRGARTVVDFAVEAGGFVPGGEHVHDHCAEHFEVRAGQITFVLDGQERVLGAGDQVTVAPGVWHQWWNAGHDEVRARVRIEPALRFEEAMLAFWGACADGHTNAEGRPTPLLGALVATLLSLRDPLPSAARCRSATALPAARGDRPAAGPGADHRSLPRSRHASVSRIGARSPSRACDAATNGRHQLPKRQTITEGLKARQRRRAPSVNRATTSL